MSRVGAMRVYEQMLETDADGNLMLPVSVSPEYRGAAMNAWGANASFQLACCHWLADKLIEHAGRVGQAVRPIWRQIAERLPKACVEQDGDKLRIGLWRGVPLEESHRHHSHLAGITPFDVIDLNDPQWQPVVEASFNRWIFRGMGAWSGWCMPWASMLQSRAGNADMSELTLEIWQRVFTNEGHGTLHDCAFNGMTLIGAGQKLSQARGEIMQMDAGMGAAAAIMDMLLQSRRGVHHLFAGAPLGWKRVGFRKIRAEGAFLISAQREDGIVTRVTIESEKGGVFRLANPWNDSRGPILEIRLSAGESVDLLPKG